VIQEVINDIVRRPVIVPGGWRANILEVEAQRDDLQWLVSALVAQVGLEKDQAIATALAMVQNRYSFGSVHGIRMSVIGYAHKYLKMFPEMAEPYPDNPMLVLPRGYKPEVMQQYYLPTIGHQTIGSVDHILQQMRDDVATR
jgi:hypothetical protein